jgi:hypothetical protein
MGEDCGDETTVTHFHVPHPLVPQPDSWHIKPNYSRKYWNSEMMLRKLTAAAFGACMGIAVLPITADARPVGTVEGMPFFGLPYPYGYVYHRPNLDCFALQQIDTPTGPRVVEVWICDAPVSARY